MAYGGPANQYVQSASGVWTPVGYAAGNATMPVNISGSAGATADGVGTLPTTNLANAAVTATVSSAGNATIYITGGTFSNLPIIFEAADSQGNFFTVPAQQLDGTGVNTAITLPANGGPRAWNVACPGITQLRVRQTGAASTLTAAPTVRIAQGPLLWQPAPTVAPIDGQKATYSAALNASGLASAVTASVPIWEMSNPGTRTVRITRIQWDLTLATAGAAPVMALQKRTVVASAGTSTAQVAVQHDSSQVAVGAASRVFTAAPTLAALLTAVREQRYLAGATTLTTQPLQVEWTFGNRPSQGLVIRPGESVNIQGVTGFATAPTISGSCEWTEE